MLMSRSMFRTSAGRCDPHNMTEQPIIHLIDASVYIFRAWHSIPDSMTTPAGEPVNAVYGFAGFIADLLQRSNPQPVLVAFDESLSSSFRNEIYPAYKANREPAPEALKRQFAWCQQLCEAVGLYWQAEDSFEADDLIGAWASHARDRGYQISIVSRDKDLAQLLKPGDVLWDFAGNVQLDVDGVKDKFGVWPEQIADYLALTGDAVDNIPGVAGVGPKAATALLSHFGTLQAVFERLDEVPDLPVRGARSLAAKLDAGRASALLARELTGIPSRLPLDPPPLNRRPADPEAIEALCDTLGFGPATRQRLRRC